VIRSRREREKIAIKPRLGSTMRGLAFKVRRFRHGRTVALAAALMFGN
jgi:hypothetical protein